MNGFAERCREWQKNNPDWKLICDMHDTDYLYVQWPELPKRARMSWIGKYGSAAKDMFEEFAVKECKVECMVLGSDMKLYAMKDWPHGNTMTVFKTSIDGVMIVD